MSPDRTPPSTAPTADPPCCISDGHLEQSSVFPSSLHSGPELGTTNTTCREALTRRPSFPPTEQSVYNRSTALAYPQLYHVLKMPTGPQRLCSRRTGPLVGRVLHVQPFPDPPDQYRCGNLDTMEASLPPHLPGATLLGTEFSFTEF